ncbi:MAG: hypothetical protein ACFFFG_04720 [Candidatus Thorarchaeota archaeon]
MEEYSKESYWNVLSKLEGRWKGETDGKSGLGKGVRDFKPIIQGRFFQGKNKVVFEPQEKNPEGEVHEDWEFYSYDSNKKIGKLRVFYSEGYFTDYTLKGLSVTNKELVFLTQENENLPDGFRARITLKLLSDNHLNDKLELANPGKDFGVCIENNWYKESSI